jgi:hypothetical protein
MKSGAKVTRQEAQDRSHLSSRSETVRESRVRPTGIQVSSVQGDDMSVRGSYCGEKLVKLRVYGSREIMLKLHCPGMGINASRSKTRLIREDTSHALWLSCCPLHKPKSTNLAQAIRNLSHQRQLRNRQVFNWSMRSSRMWI